MEFDLNDMLNNFRLVLFRNELSRQPSDLFFCLYGLIRFDMRAFLCRWDFSFDAAPHCVCIGFK